MTSPSAISEIELLEQPKPVAKEARGQEQLAGALLGRPPEAPAEPRVAQDLDTPLRSLLDRVDEVAGLALGDLKRDPADVAGDDGPHLPHRLGHSQPESLPKRLLDHHVGLRLKGVDLDRADVVQVVEDLDVRIAVRVAEGAVEELPPLGIV